MHPTDHRVRDTLAAVGDVHISRLVAPRAKPPCIARLAEMHDGGGPRSHRRAFSLNRYCRLGFVHEGMLPPTQPPVKAASEGLSECDGQASLQVDELFSVKEVADSGATPERSLSLSIARYHHEGKRCGGRRTSISLTANRRIAPLSLSRRVPKRFALTENREA